MALAGTRELTVDLVDIAGLDTPGIFVSVEQEDRRLVYPVGLETSDHETLYPRRLEARTDQNGVARFRLLPSNKPGAEPAEPLAGTYVVKIGDYERRITMPDQDARLSNLGDPQPAQRADDPYAYADLRNLSDSLSDDAKEEIRRKIGAGETADATARAAAAAAQATAAAALPKAGGTMTGPLTLSGAPTEALQAATKAYVDARAGSGGPGGLAWPGLADNRIFWPGV